TKGACQARVSLVRRLFEDANDLFVCDVTVTEALSSGSVAERTILDRLIDSLEYLSTSPEAARWAGESRRRRGKTSPRSVSDAIVGGVAWYYEATVVTRNPT